MFYVEKSDSSRVYIQIKEYKGTSRLDIREFFKRDLKKGEEVPEGCFPDEKDKTAAWQFTSKGISMPMEFYDEFMKGIKGLDKK